MTATEARDRFIEQERQRLLRGCQSVIAAALAEFAEIIREQDERLRRLPQEDSTAP